MYIIIIIIIKLNNVSHIDPATYGLHELTQPRPESKQTHHKSREPCHARPT